MRRPNRETQPHRKQQTSLVLVHGFAALCGLCVLLYAGALPCQYRLQGTEKAVNALKGVFLLVSACML